MLSTGAHNPRVAKLLKDPPNEKLLLKSKDPEKELGEDSQEEKEKENSGYTLDQEEAEKDSVGYEKDVSVLPQEVSPTPQEVSPQEPPQEVSAAPQDVSDQEPPQEENDSWRLNFSSNKPNSFSDIDTPEYKLKSIEADVEALAVPLLGNAIPFRGNVILRNSYMSACTTTSDSNTIPKAYCSVQKAEPGKCGTGLG